MPYPDLNTLSWAYVVGVLSFVSTFIAFIISFVTFIRLDELINRQKIDEDLLDDEEKIGISSPPPPPPPSHPSTLNDPSYYSEPRYVTDPQPALSYMGSTKMSSKRWNGDDSEIAYDTNEQNLDFKNRTNSRFNTSTYLSDPKV